MRRWRLPILVVIVVAVSAVAIRHVWQRRAQRRREAAYQLTLLSYSEVLMPGMTRKEVEDYLRTKNVTPRQMCCVEMKDFSKGVYDDLAKIGQEDAPWFCSEKNIYVAFQFTGPKRNGLAWRADASDGLKAVTIYRWLEGCL
jgi:hypothetical protein